MATINATITVMEDGVVLVKWLAITEADTGTPVNLARFPDRTVQVLGDFTTGGEITLEGSNDGTNYATLTDPQGDAIVITSQGLKLIAENPLYVRPRATAGSAVSMDVYIVGAPR